MREQELAINRRAFLASSAHMAGTLATGSIGALGLANLGCATDSGVAGSSVHESAAEPLFRISLAQWSLHKSHFGPAIQQRWETIERVLREDPRSMLQGDLDPLDFPKVARERGIEAVEYVNTFFFDRARDRPYLADLESRCDGEGVESLLIMCDSEGNLGDPDTATRARAVDNHVKWLEAAAFLGCHSIRVNAASRGSYKEQQTLAADGLRQLCEIADGHGLNVLVENHGGLSSNGAWLAGVMDLVDHALIGTLPDFGNFYIREDELYDRYQGVQELMPYAKAVSAKSFDFDADGDDTTTDFRRMMEIVLDAGYRGWVGIEYEGSKLSELDGIRATKALLDRVRDELTGDYAL